MSFDFPACRKRLVLMIWFIVYRLMGDIGPVSRRSLKNTAAPPKAGEILPLPHNASAQKTKKPAPPLKTSPIAEIYPHNRVHEISGLRRGGRMGCKKAAGKFPRRLSSVVLSGLLERDDFRFDHTLHF